MGIAETIQDKRDQILELADTYGATNVRIFGSVAAGPADSKSDVDFLVDLDPDKTLFDLGGFLMDLQKLLGRSVDVVTEKALHWYIRDKVLEEARPL